MKSVYQKKKNSHKRNGRDYSNIRLTLSKMESESYLFYFKYFISDYVKHKLFQELMNYYTKDYYEYLTKKRMLSPIKLYIKEGKVYVSEENDS